MAKLSNSLRDWQTDAFSLTLQQELEALRGDVLPLREVIGEGNSVLDSDLGVTVLGVTEGEGCIEAHVGVYFAEIVACCSCGESPPIDEAYCELRVCIDKSSAETTFRVINQG